MSWYAIDAVDDALAASRAFLFPFSLGRWARLAVVVLFLGVDGTAGVRVLQAVPTPASMPADAGVSARGVLLAGAAVSLAVVVLVLVAAVMRFVLLDALRTGEVRVRRQFRAHLWKGARLLGFNVGVALLLVTAVLTLVLALGQGGAALLDAAKSPGLRLGLGLFGSLFLGVVVIGGAVGVLAFYHFTVAFVAPTMLVLDAGVLTAWTRFLGLLRARPLQFAVYLFVRVVVGLGVAIAAGVPTLLGLLPFAVAAVALVAAVTAAFGDATASLLSAGVLAAGLLVIGLGYVVLVALPVRVLSRTFLTTYQLDVLGAADPDLAVLAGFDDDGDRPTGSDGSDDADASATTDPGRSTDESDALDDAGGFEFADPVEPPTNDEPGRQARGETPGNAPDAEHGTPEDGDERGGTAAGDGADAPNRATDDGADRGVGGPGVDDEADGPGDDDEDDDRPYWAR